MASEQCCLPRGVIKIRNSVGRQNLLHRESWLEKTLKQVPGGSRILDAGAGELKYKKFCQHLNYVSQDFAQYDVKGDGAGMQKKLGSKLS